LAHRHAIGAFAPQGIGQKMGGFRDWRRIWRKANMNQIDGCSANQPEVSVTVTFRKALFGSGSVAAITNISTESIPVAVISSRPSMNQQQRFDLVIDPNRFKEIGDREGWAFIPGDVIKISQPDHKPRAVRLTN
jgi:hypothetical protein